MFYFILAVLFVLGTACFSAILAKKHGKIWITGIFVGYIVMANILANKVFVFLNWAVPAGIIVYSATFLLTDILCEFYGKKSAKQTVWIGFFASVILVICIWFAIQLPPAGFWENQEAFKLVLGNTWRIVLASMVAYILSQNNDVMMYSFLKKKTNGKFLWLRNNTSTITSQFIDSVVFVTIAFYGIFPILPMIFAQFAIKVMIAITDTPFIYLVKHFYKKE